MPDVRPLFLAGIAALALAGCGRTDGQPPAASTPALPPPAEDGCAAGKVGTFLGREATPETLAELAKVAGHERIRPIRPGQAVTMDFRADRLNVDIDENGKIKRLWCA